MNPARSTGFSVIEALVAVAILGIALAAILSLQTQATRAAAREAALRAEITDQENALAILRTVNPMQRPQGRAVLDARRFIRWRSDRISPVAPSIPRDGATTAFDTALFRLHVEIHDPTLASQATFDVDVLGWRPRAAS